jgi:hypothetical protein
MGGALISLSSKKSAPKAYAERDLLTDDGVLVRPPPVISSMGTQNVINGSTPLVEREARLVMKAK